MKEKRADVRSRSPEYVLLHWCFPILGTFSTLSSMIWRLKIIVSCQGENNDRWMKLPNIKRFMRLLRRICSLIFRGSTVFIVKLDKTSSVFKTFGFLVALIERKKMRARRNLPGSTYQRKKSFWNQRRVHHNKNWRKSNKDHYKDILRVQPDWKQDIRCPFKLVGDSPLPGTAHDTCVKNEQLDDYQSRNYPNVGVEITEDRSPHKRSLSRMLYFN